MFNFSISLQAQHFNAETEDLIGQLKSELDSASARSAALLEECNQLSSEKDELRDTVQVSRACRFRVCLYDRLFTSTELNGVALPCLTYS